MRLLSLKLWRITYRDGIHVLIICVPLIYILDLYYLPNPVTEPTSERLRESVREGGWYNETEANKIHFVQTAEETLGHTRRYQKLTQPGEMHVLLLSYLRGGGQLVGEIFNQNTNACYWYEPLEGVYQSLFGQIEPPKPLDIQLWSNGSRRNIPEYEENAVLRNIQRLFDNKFEAIPVEVTRGRHMMKSHVKVSQPYRECLQHVHVSGNVDNCFKETPTMCSHSLSSRENAQFCFDSIALFRQIFGSESARQMAQASRKHEKFLKHRECLFHMSSQSQHCLGLLQKSCSPKPLVVIKTSHVSLELAQLLLKENKKLRIIHVVRDPRAITTTRETFGDISQVAQGDTEKEAKYICQQLNKTITTISGVRKRFPKRIITVKYEDFSTDPLKFTNKVYRFLNMTTPEDVRVWLLVYKSWRKSGGNKQGKLSWAEKNARLNVHAWRNKISFDAMHKTTTACRTTLEKLRYDI